MRLFKRPQTIHTAQPHQDSWDKLPTPQLDPEAAVKTSRSASVSQGPTPQKRPSITTMPNDSGASLSMSPSAPTDLRRQRGTGPYCPKRPSLEEILANKSSEPWTLEAFRAYMEQNVCAENLSFIQEADRYTQIYKQWSSAGEKLPAESLQSLTEDLTKRWKLILSDYISSGGFKELNVESSVRNDMLAVPEAEHPPKPEYLDRAVLLTKRLIEDSILTQFLKDVQPEAHSSDEFLDPEVHKPHSLQFPPQKTSSRPSSRDAPRSLPLHASSFSSAFKNSRTMPTQYDQRRAKDQPRSDPSASPLEIRPKSMFTSSREHSSSSGSTDNPNIDAIILEESTSAVASPTTSNTTSPPMSPPPGERPAVRERSDSGWKKFGAKLGIRRKGSNPQIRRPYSSVMETTTSHPRSSGTQAPRPYSTAILDESKSNSSK